MAFSSKDNGDVELRPSAYMTPAHADESLYIGVWSESEEDLMEPLKLALIIGANLFGVYALFRIGQVLYWFIRDRASKREEL
ncbi:hypothetical protein AC482_00875 [miscellaneous Crenarchaeota group-15 archaeon DG-45]|uniref:Uncharacterized protein n=1 Tax=miscellaneous Crenarchaeota group-15 archaeon DG-45 TaxID=1685127 RepID=A0A0M0BS58_9ARCH|nr:MAG: hypothetical protein AC482_00875 [miscellaneous Crenarchaeota group-15 archaeon DG-45]